MRCFVIIMWDMSWGSCFLDGCGSVGNSRPAESGLLMHYIPSFCDFFVVIFAVKNVPHSWLPSRMVRFLVLDLVAGCLIDFLFLVQQVLQNLAHFQADRISILDKVQIVRLGCRASVTTCATLFTLSRLTLTAPPYICAPVRSSLCETFPDNWLRSSASRPSRPPRSRAPHH